MTNEDRKLAHFDALVRYNRQLLIVCQDLNAEKLACDPWGIQLFDALQGIRAVLSIIGESRKSWTRQVKQNPAPHRNKKREVKNG